MHQVAEGLTGWEPRSEAWQQLAFSEATIVLSSRCFGQPWAPRFRERSRENNETVGISSLGKSPRAVAPTRSALPPFELCSVRLSEVTARPSDSTNPRNAAWLDSP
jgi:hypothetical protein